MVTLVFALTLSFMPETQSIEASDDLWVYPQAPDQTQNVFLRAWGNGASGIETAEEGMEVSWSVVRFPLPAAQEGKKLTGAKIVLTHIPKVGWNAEEAKKWPLEARLVPAEFQSKSWTFADAAKVTPAATAEAVLGTANPTPPATEAEFPIEIPLKIDGEATQKAMASGAIAFALTSSIDITGSEMKRMYKFYGKAADAKFRPKLVLTWEAGGRATGATRSR